MWHDVCVVSARSYIGKEFGLLRIEAVLGYKGKRAFVLAWCKGRVQGSTRCKVRLIANLNNICRRKTRSCGCERAEASAQRQYKRPGHALWGAVYRAVVHRARASDIPMALAEAEVIELCQQQCRYFKEGFCTRNCKSQGGRTVYYNGLDRLDSTKGYVLGNVVPCCRRHNMLKKNYTPDELVEAGRVGLLVAGLLDGRESLSSTRSPELGLVTSTGVAGWVYTGPGAE